MRLLRITKFLCLAFFLTGCTRLLLGIYGVADPVVETDHSLHQFRLEKLKDTSGYHAVLQLSADWYQRYMQYFEGEAGYEVFDGNGRRLCLTENLYQQATCEPELFQLLRDSLENAFDVCNNDSVMLKDRLKDLRFIYKTPDTWEGYDFVVIARWAKFLRAKHSYGDDIAATESYFRRSGKKILFIKLNLDLHASWGIPAGYKVKKKVQRQGREIETTWNFLPLLNSQKSK